MDLWDIHQHGQIRQNQKEAARASGKADRVDSKIDELRRDTDRKISHLTLLCQSMWELLQEHTELTDQHLRVKMADVDTRDGRANGKIDPTTFNCPKGGAVCNSTRKNCIMCGEDLTLHKTHIFET